MGRKNQEFFRERKSIAQAARYKAQNRLREKYEADYQELLAEVKRDKDVAKTSYHKTALRKLEQRFPQEARRMAAEESVAAGVRPRTRDDALYRKLYNIETNRPPVEGTEEKESPQQDH